ncbi:MAG: beta-propeller domain-containing protein [Candidatus Micrarchaeota archaeon]
MIFALKTELFVVLLLSGFIFLGCTETIIAPTPTVQPVDYSALKTFESKEDLNSFLEATQSNYGYGGLNKDLTGAPMTTQVSSESGARDYSSTNIQVEGVDEADVLKNDGDFLYVVSEGKIKILKAFPASELKLLSVINESGVQEIFVKGNKLVAFGFEGREWGLEKTSSNDCLRPYSYSSFIKIYDVSDKTNPVLAKEFSQSGNYVQSRLIGDSVIVIFSEYAYYDGPMPLYAVDGVEKELAPTDVSYFDYPDSNQAFVTLLSINLSDLKEESRKTILAGGAQTVFVSTENAFITQTVYNWQPMQVSWSDYAKVLAVYWDEAFLEKISAIDASDVSEWRKDALKAAQAQALIQSLDSKIQNQIYDAVQKLIEEKDYSAYTEETFIHKFSLGEKIDYVGKGSVPGHVLNQFSMDERASFFRIATTTTEYSFGARWFNQRSTQKNHLFVLNSNLKIVGSVRDLAPGESIYSTRFLGDKAFIVTFKKIDPLFVIDLSEPTAPKVLGQLKIPGYSNYLHPLGENYLIGLGKDAVQAEGNRDFAWYQGLKLSLFDVSDFEKPKEVSSFVIGDRGTDSLALHEHKAFLFDEAKELLVIPVLLAEIDAGKYPNGVEPSTYGDFVFQGAYVFKANTNGFELLGRVSHSSEEDALKSGYYWGGNQVKRTAFIENSLYTISEEFVKANNLTTLVEEGSVKIGEPREYPYYEEAFAVPGVVAR